MDFPSKRFARITLAVVAVVVAVAFGLNGHLYYASDLSLVLTLCLTASYGIAGAVAIAGARRVGRGSFLSGAFLTIGAGMVSMAVGFLVEGYYKFVAQTEVPYPSLADAFFFLYTPLVVLGLWMFLRIHSMRVTRRLILEATGITSLSLLLCFFFLSTLTLGRNIAIVDLLLGRSAPAGEALAEAMSLLYIATDAIYVALAVLIARVSAGKMSFGLFLFAVGIGLMTAGDVAYSIVIENGTYAEGDVSDQLYLAAGLAQAIGLAYVIRPFITRFSASDGARPAPAIATAATHA